MEVHNNYLVAIYIQRQTTCKLKKRKKKKEKKKKNKKQSHQQITGFLYYCTLLMWSSYCFLLYHFLLK